MKKVLAETLGGAIGSAVFGAILTAGLHHEAAPSVATYAHAYHNVFLWTAPFMIVSLVIAVVMREKPLSEEMIEVAEGKVEVPGY